MLAKIWRKGNLFASLVEIQTDAATVENSTRYLRKFKMDLPFDLAIPLLGIYLKELKTLIQRT